MRMSEEMSILQTRTSSWVAVAFLMKRPMLIFLAVIAASFIARFFVPEHAANLMLLFYVLSGLYFLLFLGKLFGMRRERAEVTDQRLKIDRRSGVVKKHFILPLNHISMLEIERGRMANFLKFGTITVYITGGHKLILTDMAKCEKFHEALHVQLTKQWRLSDD